MANVFPIMLVLVGIVLGTGVDAAIKAAAANVSVFTVIAWRYFLGAALTVGLCVAARRPMPSARAIRFHTMRGVIQLIAAGFFFWALTQLALAEATVIGFTAALMVAPIAWILLGERMTRVCVLASLVGFCGAAIAMSGGTEGAPAEGNRVLGIIAVMIAAVGYAVTLVLLRMASRNDDSLTSVMFVNLVPAIVMVPVLGLAALSGDAQLYLFPQGTDWFAYIGIAVLGVGTWWALTEAYGRAPAQKLAPFDYTSLVWSALMGYVFFGEAPSIQLYIGAMVIIVACLIVAFEGHFATRRQAKLPLSDIPG